MGLIPDEGKALPPPGIANRNSVWLSGVGWCTAMLHNAINHRPPLKSGLLFAGFHAEARLRSCTFYSQMWSCFVFYQKALKKKNLRLSESQHVVSEQSSDLMCVVTLVSL